MLSYGFSSTHFLLINLLDGDFKHHNFDTDYNFKAGTIFSAGYIDTLLNIFITKRLFFNISKYLSLNCNMIYKNKTVTSSKEYIKASINPLHSIGNELEYI